MYILDLTVSYPFNLILALAHLPAAAPVGTDLVADMCRLYVCTDAVREFLCLDLAVDISK